MLNGEILEKKFREKWSGICNGFQLKNFNYLHFLKISHEHLTPSPHNSNLLDKIFFNLKTSKFPFFLVW